MPKLHHEVIYMGESFTVLVMGCAVSIPVQKQNLEDVLGSIVKVDQWFVAVKKASWILGMK